MKRMKLVTGNPEEVSSENIIHNRFDVVPENPLVSVIVPVYNVESYLRQCLDSIINQTYKNLQIVCVNDGSTDGCPAILDEYAARDSRVCVIHQKNAGLGAARNVALAVCRGEWVMMCDSDDWMELHAVERMCRLVEGHDCNIGVYGHYVRYEDTGAVKNVVPLLPVSESGVYKIDEELVAWVIPHCYAWNKIYRREMLASRGLLFSEGVYYEDVSFALIAFLSSIGEQVVVCNEKLYNYRQRQGSILDKVRKGAPKALDLLLEGGKVLSWIEKHDMLHQCHIFILRMLSYHQDLCSRGAPEDMQNKVKNMVTALRKEYRIKSSLLYEWKYGRRPIPSIVKSLFFSINESNVAVKFLGVPLLRINTRSGRLRIAVLGIPVYRGIRTIPHIPLELPSERDDAP